MEKVSNVPPRCRELTSVLMELGRTHFIWDVFQDFLAMSAIAISNSVDLGQFARREDIYMQLIKKYAKPEQKKFAEALGILTATLYREAAASGPADILGQVFHALLLHNRYHGQFFTPPQLCEFMGEITLGGDAQKLHKELDGKGYITVCEPCIGAGGLVLGFAKAMQNHKYDYRTQMLVVGCDIDMKCVHMAYLQLSLLGIPAVIIHGNSLTMEEWSRWYSPAYVVDNWAEKERMNSIANIHNATQAVAG